MPELTSLPPAPPAPAVASARRRRARGLRRPSALTVSLAALALLILVIVAAPLVAPYDPNHQDPIHAFAGASWSHPFGTDDLGRDMFSRVLYGGRLTLLISGGAVVIAALLGTLWGFVAAMRKGLVDEVLMRSADTLMAIPQLLFALVCISALTPSTLSLMLVIGVLLTPSTARLARAAALVEMNRDYYSAAVAYGASRRRLLFSELLPNAYPSLAVQAAINAASAIILEASLSFVGLGVQPPQASWGTLLQQGYGFLYQQIDYALFPALSILVSIWLLNVIADQIGARARVVSR